MAIKVEQRVGVAAPVDDIWEVISEVSTWPEWSPIHKAASAEMHFGAPVHLEEYYEGLGTWTIDGTIDDWVPLSHLHVGVPKPFYAGRLIRYFEMDAISDAASAFTVGALFDGFLSEREGRRFRNFLRTGFTAFAEAVKTRAEARFAEHPEARTHVEIKKPEKPQLGPTRPNWQKNNFLFFGGNKKK